MIVQRLSYRSGDLTDHRRCVATHCSDGQERCAVEPRSGGLAFRMDGHRGQQQPREREKRHERPYAREGRGDLRGDGGDQHVKQQRAPAPPARRDRRSPTGHAFGRWRFEGRSAGSRSPRGRPVRRRPPAGRPDWAMPLCLFPPHIGPQTRASRLRGLGRIRRTPTC
jgi:hypothetical protein